MTKIAILSDIHGNQTAFEAVLEDSKKENVEEYWILGDLFLPGPAHQDMIDLMKTMPITIMVKGNWEDCVLEILDGTTLDDASEVYIARLSEYLCEHLTPESIQMIRDLPLVDHRIIHGLTIGISHNQRDKNWGGALLPSSNQQNFDALFTKDQDIAIYGHVHHQMLRYSSDDRLIINPGTVGQPFSFWKKLRKDRRAQYTILEIDHAQHVDVHFKKVAYDIGIEQAYAKKNELPYLELYEEQLNTGITHTHDLDFLEKINQENGYVDAVKDYFNKKTRVPK